MKKQGTRLPGVISIPAARLFQAFLLRMIPRSLPFLTCFPFGLSNQRTNRIFRMVEATSFAGRGAGAIPRAWGSPMAGAAAFHWEDRK